MTKIGESIPDEILARIHVSGVRMDAMAWAARSHPLYAAIRKITIAWPERAQLEAFIVGLLCENTRLRDQIIDIYRNLKPADVLIPETPEGFDSDKAQHLGDGRSDCLWLQDENGAWDTNCGHRFEFTNDGPTENGAKFCPFCGGKLTPKQFEEAIPPVINGEPRLPLLQAVIDLRLICIRIARAKNDADREKLVGHTNRIAESAGVKPSILREYREGDEQ